MINTDWLKRGQLMPLIIDLGLKQEANKLGNLVPRVSHLNAWGVKMRDPGNEVANLASAHLTQNFTVWWRETLRQKITAF